MKKSNAENKTMAAKKSTKSKVLPIKGKQDCLITKNQTSNEQKFETEYKNHLGLLLLPERENSEPDFDSLKWFGVVFTKKMKQPFRYYFYEGKGRPKENIFSDYVLNTEAILDQVKRELSEENWLSENTLDLPYNAKPNGQTPNEYICNAVLKAIDAENNKIFQYVNYLHNNID